jgi:hypothetical protein
MMQNATPVINLIGIKCYEKQGSLNRLERIRDQERANVQVLTPTAAFLSPSCNSETFLNWS